MTDDTDQKIMLAFATLASKYGYRGTTTRKIAQSAGINESTLFRHFPNKKALLKYLVDNYIKQIQTNAKSFQINGDVRADFRRAMQDYRNFIDQHQLSFLITVREGHEFPELVDASQRFFDTRYRLFVDFFQKLQNRGLIKKDINVEAEVLNLILMNFGSSVLKYDLSNMTIDGHTPEDNTEIFLEHLIADEDQKASTEPETSN